MSRHVLVVDDDPGVLATLQAELRSRGFRTSGAQSGDDALARLASDPPDVVLLDLRLGEESGLEVLDRIRSHAGADAPSVIMISGAGTIGEAVDAVRRGAIDFLEKPVSGAALEHRVRRALREARLLDANREMTRRLGESSGLVGESAGIRAVLDKIALVAPTDAGVLVIGDSGTGKELVARAIHDTSPRSGEAFVAVNASSIPRDLVESELFGHQKGAFTGAARTRRGAFELAGGGTLFLDEIGDMPTTAQPALLRVLESGSVRRVGAEREIPTDVRVIAATNQDLNRAMEAGTFRRDLYHRLDVIEIRIPPLSERPEDIPLLCEHFLSHFAREHAREPLVLADASLARLRAHRFPGNVRELRNLMERVTILCTESPVEPDALSGVAGSLAPAPAPGRATWEALALEPGDPDGDGALRKTVRAIERALVARTLDESPSVAEAARRLGLERSHLYKKLRELGLEPPPRG